MTQAYLQILEELSEHFTEGPYALRLWTKVSYPQTGKTLHRISVRINYEQENVVYPETSDSSFAIVRVHAPQGKLEDLGIATNLLSNEILGRYRFFSKRTNEKPTLYAPNGKIIDPNQKQSISLTSDYSFTLNPEVQGHLEGIIILSKERTFHQETLNFDPALDEPLF